MAYVEDDIGPTPDRDINMLQAAVSELTHRLCHAESEIVYLRWQLNLARAGGDSVFTAFGGRQATGHL
jgi:hypothetical protein